MPHRIYKRPVLLWSIILFVAWAIAAHFVRPSLLIIILRAITLAGSVAVVISYWPAAKRAIIAYAQPDLVSLLSLGIVLAWASQGVASFLALMWRLDGEPTWFANSDFFSFPFAMLMVASLLHVAAPGAIDGRIPPRNKIVLGAVIGVGILIVTGVVIEQPISHRLLELIRPIADEGDSGWTPPPGD